MPPASEPCEASTGSICPHDNEVDTWGLASRRGVWLRFSDSAKLEDPAMGGWRLSDGCMMLGFGRGGVAITNHSIGSFSFS